MTEVLIVGGGTVGLSAALFLSRHGIAATVLESRPTTSVHPRAGSINPRTMELFRGAGIEQRLRDAAAGLAANQGVLSVRTLADSDLKTAPRKGITEQTDSAGQLSPCAVAGCPQHLIDPIVLAEAREHGARVRFDAEVTELTQDAAGVTATLADGQKLRAPYAIAADGASSRVRARLGIGGTGPGELGGHMINVLFRAELGELVRGNEFALCAINNPESSGVLIPVNNTDRWLFHIAYDPAVETLAEYPPQRCAALIRAAIGLPGLDVTVLSALPWQSTARVADTFRAERVFLAGDAAHVVPPTGGTGLNTGIADVHNLAWKLAAVLPGQADPALLHSYDAERRPVAEFTMRQVLIRGQHRELHWDPRPERAADRAAVGMASLPVLTYGYRYGPGAIIEPRAMPSLEHLADDAAPGSRLPHRWITPGVSTLDLVSTGFTLLTGCAGQRWVTAANVNGLKAHHVDAPWLPDNGALLVRPDGFVGWRRESDHPDPAEALATALRGLTGG